MMNADIHRPILLGSRAAHHPEVRNGQKVTFAQSEAAPKRPSVQSAANGKFEPRLPFFL